MKKDIKQIEELKFKNESLSWLVKNAPISNPVLQEVLVKNIENCSPFIQNIEFLIDYKNYKMLLYLDISIFGKLFFRSKNIAKRAVEIIQSGFPKYGVKIYFNKDQWDKIYKELTQ
jgi:hypothetical protein